MYGGTELCAFFANCLISRRTVLRNLVQLSVFEEMPEALSSRSAVDIPHILVSVVIVDVFHPRHVEVVLAGANGSGSVPWNSCHWDVEVAVRPAVDMRFLLDTVAVQSLSELRFLLLLDIFDAFNNLVLFDDELASLRSSDTGKSSFAIGNYIRLGVRITVTIKGDCVEDAFAALLFGIQALLATASGGRRRGLGDPISGAAWSAWSTWSRGAAASISARTTRNTSDAAGGGFGLQLLGDLAVVTETALDGVVGCAATVHRGHAAVVELSVVSL